MNNVFVVLHPFISSFREAERHIHLEIWAWIVFWGNDWKQLNPLCLNPTLCCEMWEYHRLCSCGEHWGRETCDAEDFCWSTSHQCLSKNLMVFLKVWSLSILIKFEWDPHIQIRTTVMFSVDAAGTDRLRVYEQRCCLKMSIAQQTINCFQNNNSHKSLQW